MHTSPATGYLKALVTFWDHSRLAVFEHARIETRRIVKTHYRYHYMTEHGRLIFRYDNAPHYKLLETFPHHKHERSKVLPAEAPSLRQVLD